MRPGFRAKLSAALLLAVALAAAASTWIAVQVYGAFSEDITKRDPSILTSTKRPKP